MWHQVGGRAQYLLVAASWQDYPPSTAESPAARALRVSIATLAVLKGPAKSHPCCRPLGRCWITCRQNAGPFSFSACGCINLDRRVLQTWNSQRRQGSKPLQLVECYSICRVRTLSSRHGSDLFCGVAAHCFDRIEIFREFNRRALTSPTLLAVPRVHTKEGVLGT